MTAILILLVLLFPTQPAEPWTWSQRVEYQENHDPSMVWLRDGRKLQVEFSMIPWKIVDKWPAGKALELVYDAELGLRLVDPEDKKFLPGPWRPGKAPDRSRVGSLPREERHHYGDGRLLRRSREALGPGA